MSSVAVPAVSRVLFLGLDSSLCTELGQSLRGHEVITLRKAPETVEEMGRYLRQTGPDMIFCPATDAPLGVTLEAARSEDVPVIVVSRLPHAHEWLDAMEAGAADYVAAPFEPRQIEWVMSANRRVLAASV